MSKQIETVLVFKDGRKLRINKTDLPRLKADGWSQEPKKD